MNEDLVLNKSYYLQQKADGFNQGLQLAAERFELYILILLGLYAFKVLIKFPPIDKRLEYKENDLTEILQVFADVLSFFIVLLIAFALFGKSVIG